MKIAESWLREWVNPDLDTEALGHQLTMLGHEVDGIEYEGTGIAEVVVAEVVECGSIPTLTSSASARYPTVAAS